MNKQRRDRILKLFDKLEEAAAEIEELQGDELEAYENLPESLKNSERGEAMSKAADCLLAASTSIDEVFDNLTAAIE